LLDFNCFYWCIWIIKCWYRCQGNKKRTTLIFDQIRFVFVLWSKMYILMPNWRFVHHKYRSNTCELHTSPLETAHTIKHPECLVSEKVNLMYGPYYTGFNCYRNLNVCWFGRKHWSIVWKQNGILLVISRRINKRIITNAFKFLYVFCSKMLLTI